MIPQVKDMTKISSHVTIPKGMYFVPKVHRGLLAYRTLLEIERKQSSQEAINFAQNFVNYSGSHDQYMKNVYQKALSKFMKFNK